MEFFIATHSVQDGLSGKAIRLVTEARCTPPWVLGPALPCTHAFVYWTHTEHSTAGALISSAVPVAAAATFGYRLDGKPPRAKLMDLAPFVVPMAAWRLDPTRVDIKAARERAIELDGTIYDSPELGLQLLPGFEMLDVLKDAMICTGIARAVLFAAGGPARALASSMRTLFPEALAQRLNDAVRDGWLHRAV